MAPAVGSVVTVKIGQEAYSGTVTDKDDLGLSLDVHAVTIRGERQERTVTVFLPWQRVIVVELGEGVRVAASALHREANILILRYLKDGTRSRKECLDLTRGRLNKGERFTDETLRRLENAEHITKIQDKPAIYQMSDDGKQWLAANDDEEFSESFSGE